MSTAYLTTTLRNDLDLLDISDSLIDYNDDIAYELRLLGLDRVRFETADRPPLFGPSLQTVLDDEVIF